MPDQDLVNVAPESGEDEELKRRLAAHTKAKMQKLTAEANRLEESENREDVSTDEAESRASKKARLAQILQRGFVNDKLVVEGADPNRYYCWVRDDEQEIMRCKALGFVLESEKGKGLHGTGDNTRRIGDVILMSTPRDNYELIQEIRMEQKSRRSTLGKKEFLRRAKASGVPVVDPQKVGT